MFMRDIREGQVLYFSNRPPVRVGEVNYDYVGHSELVYALDEEGETILCAPPNFEPNGVFDDDPRKLAQVQIRNASYLFEQAMNEVIHAGEIYDVCELHEAKETMAQIESEFSKVCDALENYGWPELDEEDGE